MTAEPQPDAAAILETLNEIKRELAEGRMDRSSPSITVRPVKIVGESSEPAPGSPRQLEADPRIESPPPRPRRRATARRVVLGIVVACAYVAIFAAAGIFVSHAVRPRGDGTASMTAAAERAAAAVAARAHAIYAAWRGTGAAAPAGEAPFVVSGPLPRDATTSSESRLPGLVTSPSVTPPPAAAPRVQASLPVTASAAETTPPAAALRTQALATPLPPIAAAAPRAAALPAVSAPPRANTAAPPPADTTALVAPPPPAVESPRAAAAVSNPPPETAVSPAPVVVMATPSIATPSQDLRRRGEQRLGEGDIASARLFFQRAAEAGDARAALQLGGTYDPAFLTQLGVQGMRGDVKQAASWYRRASALGDAEAESRLQALPAQ